MQVLNFSHLLIIFSLNKDLKCTCLFYINMNSTLVTLVQVGLVSACVLNGFTLQVIMAVHINVMVFLGETL